jgi:hypothetical protein
MNEKGKMLFILGLLIAVSALIFNEIFIILFTEINPIPTGPHPHSMPVLVSTIWLYFVPVGFILILISVVLELNDRYHRTEPIGIWQE